MPRYSYSLTEMPSKSLATRKATYLRHTLSLFSKIIPLCFFLIVISAASGWCEDALNIAVTGVKGRLYDNVMAQLKINLYSQEGGFEESEIKRLHLLAKKDIASALAPYGYYSVSVDSSLDQSEDGWLAHYDILVGEPVIIRSFILSVTGEGETLAELSRPKQFFNITVGDILDQTQYEAGKKALLSEARALGFLDVLYDIQEIRIFREVHAADIVLQLETGPRYYFGKTDSDQDIITHELLQRFLSYKEGDYYSRTKLYEVQRDLYRTDYFGSVVVEGGTEDPDGQYVPITIKLEPRQNYNRFSVGVGYATDTRGNILFEWKNKRLNKRGHRADISMLLGELESNVLMNYKIPVVDPRYNSVAFTGIWTREEWDDTITTLFSVGTSYEYSSPERQHAFSLELRDEDYRVGDTKGTSLLLMPKIQGSWAFADDVVNTTNGVRLSALLAGAHEGVVSDATFLKLLTDGKLILSPFEGWRLLGRGSIGGILVDSIEDIPPSLRFYAGGAKSVRGYQYRSLGPVDSSGSVIGGTFLLTGSVEIERELSELFRATAFLDIGNAMDDLSVELVQGIGVGIGVVLPFGQVKIELAYPLSDEGSPQYFYLNVGADL